MAALMPVCKPAVDPVYDCFFKARGGGGPALAKASVI